MTEPTKFLKSEGIKILSSYFKDTESIKAIQRKFNNISGKTGSYFVPETLFQKRTPRKNRVLIPYEHVIKNNMNYELLSKFSGGAVVEFVNNDFFDELKKSEEEQSELFKILKTKLGSDDIVSAIIDIRSTGSSSSETQRSALNNLNNYLKDNNISLHSSLLRRKTIFNGNIGVGNEKWEGFVYYNIRGGQQDAIDSHVKANIPKNNVQLFNPSVEYADEKTSLDITLVLIYFALFSIQEQKRDENWDSIVKRYEEYFKVKTYNGLSLFDYVSNHICLNLNKGILMDPIQVEPICIEDFTIKSREDNSLDITHQTSVKKAIYIHDTDNDTILSPAHPTNLFWSKHLSNMMQQDFSLDEYYNKQKEIIKKWEDYGIGNINNDCK